MTIPIFELLLTSSLLILALIAVRYALRGRISPRLQYALWALVLVRLLVPVSLSSPMSVMNAAEPAAERMALYLYDATQVIPTPQENPDADGDLTAPVSPSKAITWANDGFAYEYTPAPAYKSAPAVSVFKALPPLWAAGALFVGAWFLWSNFRFWRMLRRKRNPFDASAYDVSLPVYVVEVLPSPCLFGLLHPAIYLTPERLLCAATTMSGSARSRRERIALIAKGHRMKAATAVLVALLACLCAVCMLTGRTRA